MRLIIIFIYICSYTCIAVGQNNVIESNDTHTLLDQYTASNGITYKIGDKIELSETGTKENKAFKYFTNNVSRTAKAAVMDWDNNIYSWKYQGSVKIKRIYHFKETKDALESVLFIVKNSLFKYHLYIEGAIARCEIINCNKEAYNHFLRTRKLEKATIIDDKYTALEKAKKLMSEGVLSVEEYEKEKQKILKRKY